MESRNEEKQAKLGGASFEVRLISGAHEKVERNDPGYPYPEPAQVPLAEKAKA